MRFSYIICNRYTFITSACKAKSFKMAVCFFSPSLPCFGTNWGQCFAGVFLTVTHYACDQFWPNFIELTEKWLRKRFFVNLFTVGKQHSQHPKRTEKQRETRKQDGKWQKTQWSKKGEIELISKNDWRKGKENVFKRRNWLIHYMVATKILLLKNINIPVKIMIDDYEVS